ncbi:MAG: LamG domain-containing protein, partial [Flavobacteriaceae bacterium]|nr:LamG domain-containing protein [Flavobacteriaceae bacterium]
QSVTIDFDGIDDFVLVDALNGSATALTYMAWVKLDPTAFGDSVVMGEFNNILYVNDDQTISAVVKTDSGTFSTSSTEAIPKGIWVHLTSVYDGTSLKIYINGEEVSSVLISGTSLVPSNTNFYIGRSPNTAVDFINANIQEVKVYDIALSESQVQEQVYQSLINSNGIVVGATTNLPISGLSWSDLKLYLKLTSASSGTTSDSSLLSNVGLLLNMTTLQETTAPMPYEANNSGDWTSTATWTYGSVWDITSLPHKDWAIVSLTNNAELTTSSSHTHLGLLLASGTSLKVANDQAIHNSQYLRLNGTIDLQGESQLIQGVHSVLDPSSSGYLERDQQGHSSLYNYNYWCSPVGSINTSLNNKSYTISEVLHDGTTPDSPVAINFTASGYDGAAGSPITLASYWMYAFRNQPDDYHNWTSIGASGQLAVGEGYTHKGTGTAALSQNYTFIGKPNNGTITHTITDDNLYLVGNPYPSALDANQFIQDNLQTIDSNGDVIQAGTTTGALYFWEHWGGDSHILDYYQGGYATYNLTGATLAVPDPDVSDTGSGSYLPKRYIPVGQGFFVQGDQDGGVLEFNNQQRVFQRESDGNSVFISRHLAGPLRTNDSISRMHFKFKTPEGASRHLLLGVKTGLLDGINYGYDAHMLDWQFTDCAFVVDSEPLVIQAIGELYSGLILPLKIQVGAQGDVSFLAEDLSGLPADLKLYFFDSQTAT